MNFFEPSHLIIVGIIVLLLFGGDRLPELMRSVGKGVGELKKGIDEGKRQLASAIEEHQLENHLSDEHQAEEIKFVPPTDTVHYGEDHEKDEPHGEEILLPPPAGAITRSKSKKNDA